MENNQRELLAFHRDGHSWHEAGQGEETIVFLHPIVGTSVYWAPVIAELAPRRRCVAWNAPGYCGSDPVMAPLAVSVTTRLVEFFEVAKIDKAHVVGLSLGAMFALHAAGEEHGLFDRLVLADTSAAFGIDPDEWLDDWLGGLRAGTPLTEVVDGSIDAITHTAPDRELQRRIVASFDGVSNEAFETASRYIAGHDVRERLKRIENRTLVLVGERDGETPPEYGREIASLLPHASFMELSGLGHLTSLEDPQRFAGLVQTFLDSD